MNDFRSFQYDTADCFSSVESPYIRHDVEVLLMRGRQTASVQTVLSTLEEIARWLKPKTMPLSGDDVMELRTRLGDLLWATWSLKRQKKANLPLLAWHYIWQRLKSTA